MAEPFDFLGHLWPQNIPQGARLLVWTLRDKRSAFFEDVNAAAEFCLNVTGSDVYFGAGLAPEGLRANQRAKSVDVLGIPGLWLDLDYRDGEAHKKKNLPTREEALAFIEGIATPTVVVHSGHGYQCWWLFDEPWVFADGDADRAASLQQGWVYAVRDKARLSGWDVDATIDLARVMRVPGTSNLKGSEPVPCEVEAYNLDARTSVEEWADRISAFVQIPKRPSDALSGPPARSKAGSGVRVHSPPKPAAGGLLLNPNATPPFDKWEALQGTNPQIVKTWQRDRRDFKDTSPSAYDMALASYCVAALWTDQEITDLLIACRRLHADDLKLREDYYERTIRRARATVDTQRVSEAIGDLGDDPDPTQVLDGLSALFGVKLLRVVKFLGDPPVYTLEVQMGGEAVTITLGGVETILAQRSFRAKVAAAVNHVIPKCSDAAWDQRAQAILRVLTVEDIGPEAMPAGAARAWLQEYLQQHKASEAVDEALITGRPYIEDGKVHITLRSLAFWLRTVQGERISSRELGRYLRMAGFEQHTRWLAGQDGNGTTRSVWRGPAP